MIAESNGSKYTHISGVVIHTSVYNVSLTLAFLSSEGVPATVRQVRQEIWPTSLCKATSTTRVERGSVHPTLGGKTPGNTQIRGIRPKKYNWPRIKWFHEIRKKNKCICLDT